MNRSACGNPRCDSHVAFHNKWGFRPTEWDLLHIEEKVSQRQPLTTEEASLLLAEIRLNQRQFV